MNKIQVGIIGYGNLGRGVELSIMQQGDMELAAVFTRRDPGALSVLTETAPVLHIDEIETWQGKIDVMILCGGSATDLPVQGPQYAAMFNTVDSFDTHAKIPEYYAACDKAAKEGDTISLISAGWDPGLFSLNRLYAGAVLPQGTSYTFWGKGVSQGHSFAIRSIEGVVEAKQYSIPVPAAVKAAKSGKNPVLTPRQSHTRECFVVAAEGADLQRIEDEIKTMPNYFADYDTTVNFISAEEFERDHRDMPHAGMVIHSGTTGENGKTKQLLEYSLKLGSNPEFTSSVLVCYARAVVRLSEDGQTGARTVLDVPPAYLSEKSAEELRATLL